MKYPLLLVGSLFCSALGFAQTCDEYTELTDTKPYDPESVWKEMPSSPCFRWGSVDVRYPKRNLPRLPNENTTWKTKAWKGERINAQAVLWTREQLTDVQVRVGELRSGSCVIPSSAIRPSFLRYVMTDELNKDGKSACGPRPDPSAWDSSLVADVLYKPEWKEIQACTAQPVWIQVHIPQSARPGLYKGVATVSGKDFADRLLMLEITVLDRVLPAPEAWRFHLDLWQNPYAVARYYHTPLWSEAHFEAMRPIMKQLAEAGQKVITTTILHKPWNGQTEDPFDSMVSKIKKIDGAWEYDYTVFDQWVEFMTDLGIDKQINCYTMIPWALRFDYFDQATNRVRFIEAQPGDGAYTAYWDAFLRDFSAHLRRKGWFERTTIAMDERGLEAMKEAIKVIRKADPEFKISLAGNYHQEIANELHDFCLSFGSHFPEDVKAARNKAGKVSTVYTCCAEARPNTFTFSPPAEAAWIGWHVAAGGYDGYLRWAYNSWTTDPLRDSRFRTWAAGDCYLVYPGYSSIRMERLIEGIQDYEKIHILREEFADKKADAKRKKLDAAVSMFTHDKIQTRNVANDLHTARNILNSF
ncbi:MAG: DUF4091 domain-containing protein [Tannerellaceae bacterium]|jgi:hypothetical protein|nr:DUF4091 domain-containing protein [Tannerellaceae bacterium]